MNTKKNKIYIMYGLLTTITKTFFILALTLLVLLQPQAAHAQGPQAWSGVCVADALNPDGSPTQVATIAGIQCLIANVLMVAVTLIGLAAFIVIIISAFQVMLSGGDSKGLEAAKGSITYAIAGIVVALSAFIVLQILSNFTGINLLELVIPTP